MEPAENSGIKATPETDPRSLLRFPGWYNPYTPEAIERRRKLLEEINRNRTAETDAAMEKVYQMFIGDKNFE